MSGSVKTPVRGRVGILTRGGLPSADWWIWNGLHASHSFDGRVLHWSYRESWIYDFSIDFLEKYWRNGTQIRGRDRAITHRSTAVVRQVRFSVVWRWFRFEVEEVAAGGRQLASLVSLSVLPVDNGLRPKVILTKIRLKRPAQAKKHDTWNN